jgi:hypothetical protein
MNRRSVLLGVAAALAAPAVVRTPGLLMPVRRIATVRITEASRPYWSMRWEIADIIINCNPSDTPFRTLKPLGEMRPIDEMVARAPRLVV